MARSTHVDIPNGSGVFRMFDEENEHETDGDRRIITEGQFFVSGHVSLQKSLWSDFEKVPNDVCVAETPGAFQFVPSPIDDLLGAYASDAGNVLRMFNDISAGAKKDFDELEKTAVPAAPAAPAIPVGGIQSIPPANLEKVLQVFRELTSKNFENSR